MQLQQKVNPVHINYVLLYALYFLMYITLISLKKKLKTKDKKF
jgi:hypothetical protein